MYCCNVVSDPYYICSECKTKQNNNNNCFVVNAKQNKTKQQQQLFCSECKTKQNNNNNCKQHHEDVDIKSM
jgi:hypothetical protein